MQAIITNAEKQTLPRFNNETNQDEPTVMVVVTVDFKKDDGTLALEQTYSYLPADLPTDPTELQAVFDKQAAAMQADLDISQVQQQTDQQSQVADEVVQSLNQLINKDANN
jgi:hypothetical protein